MQRFAATWKRSVSSGRGRKRPAPFCGAMRCNACRPCSLTPPSRPVNAPPAPRPHLAFFVPTLAGGGAERVIVTLANAFTDAGHTVDLLLTSRRGPLSDRVSPRVSVVDFGRQRTWHTVPALVRTLRRRQPDVLVSALFGATVAAYGATSWMHARGERVPPLCATVHAPLPRTDAQGLRARLQVRAAHHALRRADRVVAVSARVARDLSTHAGRSRDRIDVIHNPIDVDAVQAGAQAPSPHDWFRDDVPVIVSAGRLHVQKAHRILLRALARLREQRPVRALLLGDGPEQERLEAQSRRLGIFADTSFLGFVDNPYAFMARADALALPSAAEAFGNVAVEALACGTPVVATASSGGPVEILRTDSAAYGALVPPHDPPALAEALAAAIDQPADPQRLRRRARDFDVAVAVDRYRALFAQLARGASLLA